MCGSSGCDPWRLIARLKAAERSRAGCVTRGGGRPSYPARSRGGGSVRATRPRSGGPSGVTCRRSNDRAAALIERPGNRPPVLRDAPSALLEDKGVGMKGFLQRCLLIDLPPPSGPALCCLVPVLHAALAPPSALGARVADSVFSWVAGSSPARTPGTSYAWPPPSGPALCRSSTPPWLPPSVLGTESDL